MDFPNRSKNFASPFSQIENSKTKENSAVELRKNKREELATKRRNLDTNSSWITLKDHYPETYSIDQLSEILSLLPTNESTTLLFVAQAIRKILCSENSPISEICESPFINFIPIWLSRNDLPQLQYETCWICTNIASSDSCQILTIIEALPVIVRLLVSTSPEVRNMAAWVLGNIAANSSEERDLLLNLNSLELLIACLEHPIKPKDKKNIIWALSNFCRKKPKPEFEIVKKAFFVFFSNLDIKVPYPLLDILWSISAYLNILEVSKIIVEQNVLIEFLSAKNKDIRLLAIKIIGGLCCLSGTYTQILLEKGVCIGIKNALDSKSRKLRKEAVWALANICGETAQQLDFVFNAKIFEKVLNCAELDCLSVKVESAWALCNASAVARPDQIVKLVELGIFKAFISLLEENDSVINIVLQGILKILECGQVFFVSREVNLFVLALEDCDGFNKVARLQFHQNLGISTKAARILSILEPGECSESTSLGLMEEIKSGISF